MRPVARSRAAWLLTAVAVLGLVVDAAVHLRLAVQRDAVGTAITQGELFRAEAAVATLAMLAVLARDARWTWAAAGSVGLAGCAAVVLCTYVHVGAIGPVPDMYEPIWFPAKTLSAIAEAAVGMAWVGRAAICRLMPADRWRLPSQEPVDRG